MRDLFDKLKNYLKNNKIDGLYFNSTNEFLMEYNILELNSSFKLTGFTGSVSMGAVLKDTVHIFVDSRYHAQAELQIKDDFIVLHKVPLTKTVTDEFLDFIPSKFKLGVPSKKISKNLYDAFVKNLTDKHSKVIPLEEDGIEVCDGSYIPEKDYDIREIPPQISGKSIDKKIMALIRKYKGAKLIITDLSDIAYFTNLRCFDFPYISSFPSKMIVSSDGAVLYVNSDLNIYSKMLKTKYFNEFYNDLSKIKNSKVFYQNISLGDYNLIDKTNDITEGKFSSFKSVKNENEIEHYKFAFNRSDRALKVIEDMLNSDKIFSEFDFSKALVESLYKSGACSLSFKPIVACAENSAIIHYSTPSKDKLVKNGDLLLVDFGAYYDGGYATDTTRTFIKGKPSKEQKRLYTTVLKAFLNAYHRGAKQYYDIDINARKIIDKNLGKEYPFAHSTGHGVGINVHEVPPRVSNTKLSKVKIIKNTVFSIEPGAYKEGFGGVRLENTVYAANIDGEIRPQTLSKYKFENKLIDKSLLNLLELKWLKQWQEEYERTYLSE